MTAPQKKFPEWIRRPWPTEGKFQTVKGLVEAGGLHTVCQSAHCPNQSECWGRGTATFMVLGNECTRHCAYCAVNTGRPGAPEAGEPAQVAQAVARMQLQHVVITSVTRDDLPDGGADHIARTLEAIKRENPDITIEVLVQDFNAEPGAIHRVLDAGAEIFSHNIETVARLFPKLRDKRFTYGQSLEVLRIAADSGKAPFIKSSFMLGCGETPDEVRETLRDLLAAGCTAAALGQYLQPTPKHHPVIAYVAPETFSEYEEYAYEIGFRFAVAGPFVRSSYRSEALLASTEGSANHEN